MNQTDSGASAAVTAARPESIVGTTGWDHVTLIGSNAADTIAFYRDVLGLPLVLRQPNLDQPEVEHLFFDAGDGRVVTFFVEEGRDSHEGPQEPGTGAVHHLAFRIAPDELADIRDRLLDAGHRVSEFDRGAFHSLYTHDHNGLVIELAADKFEIPDGCRGEVLAVAHRHRVEDGADYVRGEDLESALRELDIEVVPNDLPDAPAGTGVARGK